MFLFNTLSLVLLAVLSSCHASILEKRDNRNNVYEMVMSKARDLERSILKDAEGMEKLEEELEDSNINNADEFTIPEFDMGESKGCSCDRSSGCKCCLKLPVLKDTVCVEMTYLRDELGIQLEVTYNGKMIIEQKISVKDPKPVCVKITGISACFTLSNLSATAKEINGCLKIDIKEPLKKTVNVGCFTLPLPGEDVVKGRQMMIPADKHLSDTIIPEEDLDVSTGNNVDEMNIPEMDVEASKECSCKSNECSCCQDVNIKIVKGTVCEQLAYLPQQGEIKLAVTYNGRAFITKTFSVSNPPSICAKIPHLKLVKACIKITGLSKAGKDIKGCSQLEIKVVKVKKTFNLGCFSIPLLDDNDSTGLRLHKSHGDLFMMMIIRSRENK